MAFQTRGFIDGKKTAMIYQTTDTIAVCSANDYFERCQVGNLIVILCSNGEKMFQFFLKNWLTMYLKNFKNSMSS
jgi:hypothetical protein